MHQSTIILLLLLLFTLPQPGHANQELDHVSVQFEWLYQFQYAGFIAAKEKGFYQQAGLDVELREYQPGINVAQQVDRRAVNYGTHNSLLIFDGEQLKPAVMLASYFQHSPLVFVSHSSIKHPSDILGKRLMGTTDELMHSGLALLLNHFSIDQQNTTLIEHSFNIEDFVEGKVDVMSAFRSNQLYELDRQNIEYNIIDPADYGFYTTAVNLYASPDEVLEHPERTRRFVEATNRGWEYALRHSDELIEIIHQKYSKRKSVEALKFEAKVTRKMMLADLFPIGWTSEELGNRLIVQLKNSGLLAQEASNHVLTLNKVMQLSQDKLPLTHAELNHLLEKREIRYCVDPDRMPLEGIHNGKHQGISGDIFKQVAELLPVPLTLTITRSWTESLKAVKSGRCDLLSLAAFNKIRGEHLQFTDPYLKQPLVMATRNSQPFIADLNELGEEQAIGVVKGHFAEQYLRSHYPSLKIVTVRSSREGLNRVSQGELLGYVDNLLLIASEIQKAYSGEMKISARLERELPLAIAVNRQDPILHQIFQKVVEHLNNAPKARQQIINEWITVEYPEENDYALLIQTLIVIVVIMLLLLYRQQLLKRSATQLQHARDQIALIVDTMGEGIAVIDNDGEIRQVNQRFEVMSGYSQQELVGQRLGDFFVGKREEEGLQSLLQDLSTPLSTLFTREPEKFDTLTMESPLAILVVGEDGVIEASNKAFTLLSGWKSKQLVGQTLEPLLPESIRSGHQQMLKQYMHSPEARNMGGRLLPLITVEGKAKELEIGLIPLQKEETTHVMVLLHDPMARRIWEFFKISTLGRLVQETTDRVQLRYQLQQAGGTTLPVEVTVATMNQNEDLPDDTSAVLVIQDITEHLKQSHRDQYEAFQDGLAEMSSTVLHNIGNVVTALRAEATNCSRQVNGLKSINEALGKLYAKLKSGDIDQKKFIDGVKLVKDALENIRCGQTGRGDRGLEKSSTELDNGLGHITDIIRTFRETSQGRSSNVQFNLREMVKDTANIVEGQLHRHEIDLQIKIPEEIELNLPRNLTMQMLLNLIKNSIDAINQRKQTDSQRKYQINISAQQDGESVTLKIQDNGCGIPEPLQPGLFERGTTTKESSAGIGLHSVANYVQSIKGRQWVKSEGENRGAIFYISLPLTSL